MTDSAQQFYDQLAADYHLLFADWRESVRRQGVALDRLVAAQLGPSRLAVLDCSCGIGTQAIGLALHGHAVHATDLSPEAVDQARRNAKEFGVALRFGVADVRRLAARVPGEFDVVLSCDNSLPHLLGDDDLLLAARNMRSKLRANGLFLASIRDYDRRARERPEATTPSSFSGPEGRRVSFQLWDWHEDGHTYALHLFILREVAGRWETTRYETRYWTLLRDEFSSLLRAAGFADIRWHPPEESGYYQPIVTARKGGAEL